MSDVTILLLNIDAKLDVKKLVDFVTQNIINAQIYMATSKKVKISYQNVKNYVFENATNDEALNTIIKDVDTEKLIVVRKCSDLNDILKVYKALRKSNQIAVLAKKTNKIRSFFEKISDYITGFLLGYKFLHASLGVVGFSRDVTAVLKQLSNASTYTKIDKWVGIEIVKIETKKLDKVKFKPKLTSDILKIALYTLLTIAPIICWIFIDTIQKYIMLQLLCIFFIILFVCLVAIQVILLSVKIKIGNNTHKTGEIKSSKRRKNEKSEDSN